MVRYDVNAENTTRRSGGKARLLGAASDLFPLGGYQGVSVSSVLQASGLKAPSLYHHFGDKEGLYAAWAVHALNDVRERVQGIESENRSPSERLERIAEELLRGASFDVLQFQRDLRLLRKDWTREAVTKAVHEALYDPVRSVLSEVVESGSPAERLDRLTRLFVHEVMCLHPTYRDAVGGLESRNGKLGARDSQISEVVAHFMRGLGPRESR